jgi:hypothetical protein
MGSTSRRCLCTATRTRRARSTFPAVSRFPRAASKAPEGWRTPRRFAHFGSRRATRQSRNAGDCGGKRSATPLWEETRNHSNHVTPCESTVAAALCRRTPRRFAHFESHPPSPAAPVFGARACDPPPPAMSERSQIFPAIPFSPRCCDSPGRAPFPNTIGLNQIAGRARRFSKSPSRRISRTVRRSSPPSSHAAWPQR